MGMSLCKRWMTIGGVNLDEFNCHLLMPGIATSPERDVDVISVPGRNGDLIIDNGRFKNITIEYKCVIDGSDSQYDFERLTAWLKSLTGYQRIEECYHSDYYRMGLFSAVVNPDEQNAYQVTFTLKANCKPQKILHTGEVSTKPMMWMPLTTAVSTTAEYWHTPNFTYHTGDTLKVLWLGTDTTYAYCDIWSRTRMTSTSIKNDALSTWQNGEYFDITSYLTDGEVFFLEMQKRDGNPWKIQTDIPTGNLETYSAEDAVSIYNPTPFEARPLFRIDAVDDSYSSPPYFTQFYLNNILVRIDNHYLDDHSGMPLFIDCDTQNCYCIDGNGAKQNANSWVTLIDRTTGEETTDFPVLVPGENEINASFGETLYYYPMSTWTLTPRWYTI